MFLVLLPTYKCWGHPGKKGTSASACMMFSLVRRQHGADGTGMLWAPRKWWPDLAQEDRRPGPSEVWILEELSKCSQLPARRSVIQRLEKGGQGLSLPSLPDCVKNCFILNSDETVRSHFHGQRYCVNRSAFWKDHSGCSVYFKLRK